MREEEREDERVGLTAVRERFFDAPVFAARARAIAYGVAAFAALMPPAHAGRNGWMNT